MFFNKFVRILLLLVCFFIFSLSTSYAADFKFDYNVNYSILENGATNIKHEITITNLESNYYTKSFTLTTTSEQIKNINAWDNLGQINPQTQKTDKDLSIKIDLNEKNVGLNKQTRFYIQYESMDIATKKGNIWEVIIPGIIKNNDISSYNIYLQVPSSFGKSAYVFPKPNSDGNWTLKELNQGGINIIYGTKQVYSFNLIYDLTNLSSKYEIQEIALPPDTAYQKVILDKVSVPPDNISLDYDGNWLAQYKLKPKEKLKVIAEGNILVYMEPYENSPVTLSSEDINNYTKPLKYWENNTEIIQKAQELKHPRNIYDWVVNNLSYDFDINTVGSVRNGATNILHNPSLARCMDFSDLFIALARSANIPSREIHGYAYTTNSKLQPLSLTIDVLHAWPQYFDFEKKAWISVDPTWGNTTHGIDYFDKLDFNHVALAILGKESNYPYPAGSFYSGNSTKSVFIDLANADLKVPDIKFAINISQKSLFYGLNNKINLIVQNSGNVLLKKQDIQISSNLKTVNTVTVPAIPPYGHADIPITINPNFTFTKKDYAMNLSYFGNQQTINITLIPTFLFGFPFTFIIFLFGIILVYLKYGKRKT